MKENKASKKSITKKEIRAKIQDSVNHAIVEFEKAEPSKRLKKVVQKASNKIAKKIKSDLKKVKVKAKKVGKKKLNGKLAVTEITA